MISPLDRSISKEEEEEKEEGEEEEKEAVRVTALS